MEIERMYNDMDLEFLPTFEKAKTVLSIYRNVVWSIKNTADNILCESHATYGKELDTALLFLSEFAPEYKKQEFEDKVNYLFESKWLIGIIDNALKKISDYPVYGKIYFSIIYHYYLSKERYDDNQCMYITKLERTCYYQRKKEAISLMGISLWGFALPNLLKEIERNPNQKYPTSRLLPVYTSEGITRVAKASDQARVNLGRTKNG